MISSVSNSDIINACQILFSPGAQCSPEFINNIKPSALKIAFRKKAFETHPDRSRAMGRREDEQSRLFREVHTAYEVLRPVADGVARLKIKVAPDIKNTAPKGPATDPFRTSSFYTGALPEHKLRLGQFMYYSGVIPWKTLVDALSWQRRLKPLYGQIALEWEMLERKDIDHIMKFKGAAEKIGEYAKKHGFLTGFQHLAIMGKQRKHHRLIGDYFIEKGILSPRQLELLVRRTHDHNIKLGFGGDQA